MHFQNEINLHSHLRTTSPKIILFLSATYVQQTRNKTEEVSEGSSKNVGKNIIVFGARLMLMLMCKRRICKQTKTKSGLRKHLQPVGPLFLVFD